MFPQIISVASLHLNYTVVAILNFKLATQLLKATFFMARCNLLVSTTMEVSTSIIYFLNKPPHKMYGWRVFPVPCFALWWGTIITCLSNTAKFSVWHRRHYVWIIITYSNFNILQNDFLMCAFENNVCYFWNCVF